MLSDGSVGRTWGRGEERRRRSPRRSGELRLAKRWRRDILFLHGGGDQSLGIWQFLCMRPKMLGVCVMRVVRPLDRASSRRRCARRRRSVPENWTSLSCVPRTAAPSRLAKAEARRARAGAERKRIDAGCPPRVIGERRQQRGGVDRVPRAGWRCAQCAQ